MSTENPYEAPAAAVVAPKIPQGYLEDAGFGRKLRALTWLAVTYVVLSGFILVIRFDLAFVSQDMTYIVQLLGDIVFIYLVLSLREFLARRFGCKNVIWPVIAIVAVTIVSFILDAAIWLDSSYSTSLFGSNRSLVLVPYGIAIFALGFNIRKIKERFPYLTAFAWVNMTIGASMTVVVLAFMVSVFGPLWDILLAMIFVAAAREFRQSGVAQ